MGWQADTPRPHQLLFIFFWVEGLVEVDPEDAGKQRYGQDEREKQNDSPDYDAIDAPVGGEPEREGDDQDGS